MSQSSASNFSPTSLSIGKISENTADILLDSRSKENSLGHHFQSKLAKANLALLGKGISAPKQ